MLPTALVDAASLAPGKEYFAITFAAQIGITFTPFHPPPLAPNLVDARGQISDYKIAPSILANVHKVPYAKVDAILEGTGIMQCRNFIFLTL